MGGGLLPTLFSKSIHPSPCLSIVATACCTRPLSKLQNVPQIYLMSYWLLWQCYAWCADVADGQFVYVTYESLSVQSNQASTPIASAQQPDRTTTSAPPENAMTSGTEKNRKIPNRVCWKQAVTMSRENGVNGHTNKYCCWLSCTGSIMMRCCTVMSTNTVGRLRRQCGRRLQLQWMHLVTQLSVGHHVTRNSEI